jgi:DNA-binding XRE family transcriptional regulator
MTENKIKTYTLEELTDKHIGKRGTEKRDQFEFDLKLDILGDMIKKARKEQHLTQEQLGQLIGVQKAQISKIESNAKDVRFSTILRVFEALKAKVKMTVEFDSNSFFEVA